MLNLDATAMEDLMMAMEEWMMEYHGMEDWEPPSYDEVAEFFNDQGLSLTDQIYNFLLGFDPETNPEQVGELQNMLGIDDGAME